MNHSENAHSWANKTKKQSSSNSNIKFWDFETIYSYGTHFILAQRVNFEGKEYIFLNENGYSNSTTKHKTHVWRACSHLETISVPFFKNNHFHLNHLESICEQLVNEGLDLFKKQIKARTNWHFYNNGMGRINLAHRVNNTFKLGLNIDSLIDFELRAKASEKAKLARENFDLKQEQKREKVEKERILKAEKEKEILQKWLIGEYNGTLYNVPIHLRFSDNGQNIQTSHGAKVPTREAYLLLNRLRNGEDCKGQRIGGFTLINNTLDFVQIGCHKINWTIINNFFKV